MRKCPTHFKVIAEKQEGHRIQRFIQLDRLIDMENWWIVWINKDILLELGREYSEVAN